MKHPIWKPGDILAPVDTCSRCIILINISAREIKNIGINADEPGLIGFGGMWYGENFMDRRSYGKIYFPFYQIHKWIKIGHYSDFSPKDLKDKLTRCDKYDKKGRRISPITVTPKV